MTMTEPVLTISDTIGQAFDHMETHGVPSVHVVDQKHAYLGTVTEAELRRHVAQRGRLAMYTRLRDVVVPTEPRQPLRAA